MPPKRNYDSFTRDNRDSRYGRDPRPRDLPTTNRGDVYYSRDKALRLSSKLSLEDRTEWLRLCDAVTDTDENIKRATRLAKEAEDARHEFEQMKFRAAERNSGGNRAVDDAGIRKDGDQDGAKPKGDLHMNDR